ncbi:MAG: cyclase family protein, partial [Oscillospiraceae bacterium]
EDMPMFPGTRPPQFTTIGTMEKNGYRETLLTLSSHTGTHMDAPAHMLADGMRLENCPPDRLFGQAAVVDCTGLTAISAHWLRAQWSLLRQANYVLLYTGWQEKWDSPDYFTDFPQLDLDAAALLTTLPNLYGVGVDALSVDWMDNVQLERHHILLEAGLLIVENLCNLHLLPVDRLFPLAALPIKVAEGDGAPARVLAILDKEDCHA